MNPNSAPSSPVSAPIVLPGERPVDWEALWAPYDEGTYQAALDLLRPEDVVLDIGAGDLRFARRAARCVRKVIAVERNRSVLGTRSAAEEPDNLTVVCADALLWPVPAGVTVAVLLMRHCRHFKDHLLRLRAAGCRRLITNARWGMDVECVPLEPQPPYWSAPSGWYACACGAVGFKTPAGGTLPASALDSTVSVEDCPACLSLRVVPFPAGGRR